MIPYFLLVIFLTIIISSYLTYKIMSFRMRQEIRLSGKCPFKNACVNFDDLETKLAAKRVAKLLIENIKTETEYKQEIKRFLQNIQ